MGLDDLRSSAEEYEHLDGPDLTAHMQEPRLPQPNEPGYGHSLFFDANRFPTQAEQDHLLERVRGEFPAGLRWIASPASAATLHGRMHLYSAYHTHKFQRDGYVAEIERPRFKVGPAARSIRSQQAWDAFFATAVIAEAIVDACRKLPLARRRNQIFADPVMEALTPAVGKTRKHDATPGTKILCVHEGLLLAPRRFNRPYVVYPADPVTCKTAFKSGRSRLSSSYSHNRLAIRRRIDAEVMAWSNHIGEGFSIDGLVLWITQALGVLRVEATEWRFRERPSYVKSGTREFADVPGIAATKDEDVQVEFARILDGLRRPANFIAPTIQRLFGNARTDVISVLAGGTGLEDEDLWRDQDVARRTCSRTMLVGVAGWISELRRLHRATLTLPMAELMREIATGDLFELNDLSDSSDRSALALVKAQFSDAVWTEMLEIAADLLNEADTIEVRYRWNDNPVDPVRVERAESGIVVVGPLLDLTLQKHEFWAGRAERFRGRGVLTI